MKRIAGKSVFSWLVEDVIAVAIRISRGSSPDSEGKAGCCDSGGNYGFVVSQGSGSIASHAQLGSKAGIELKQNDAVRRDRRGIHHFRGRASR